ncbi:selenide, water dikinase SelD [Loigolactobacillus jiayinensis]|uniref:Selenide, water dikinase n=1 Tax=Loigolactobacillus jiayinensis TaxID=2486016 RepID=A0ABW1RAW6_9LACO|nr:selenide, water dikinase SelD [Loigolactobacillus jiayinensis]
MEGFLASCTSGGCGAKIGAADLHDYLQALPQQHEPNLLVGFNDADDAAVYKISPERALISTIDFFSPMVDDPYTFGTIAAANALSDVYSMGGQPLYALNIVCFPERLPKKALAEMLSGGAAKVQEAGIVLVGGHSIYDHEPKYGLAVTGEIAPDQLIQNHTPEAGDVLILTKALGVSIVLAAARADVGDEQATAAAIASMQRLNKYAAAKFNDFQVHACTDITGFGLLAHSLEMAGTEHTLVIDTAELPILAKAAEFAAEFLVTAGGERNREHVGNQVDLTGITPAMQELLFDPQTSGGLLISVAEKDAALLLAAIQEDDPVARIIGVVNAREQEPIILL